MALAIDLGSRCVGEGQHPVGAVVTHQRQFYDVDESRVVVREVAVGRGENQVWSQSQQHAELVALNQAEARVGRRKLGVQQGVLYTTHEPCPMCAGAIANSKLAGVVFGTDAEDARALVRTEGIRWRSNAVSGLDVIAGRQESGGLEQFVIGNFMRGHCRDLLKTARDLA